VAIPSVCGASISYGILKMVKLGIKRLKAKLLIPISAIYMTPFNEIIKGLVIILIAYIPLMHLGLLHALTLN
jgi:hypothetical protein